MIGYKDIHIAINGELEKTGVEVSSRDVTEGFARPSFFVQFANMNRESTQEQLYRNISVYIYYFPEDRHEHTIENLEMQERLEDLFDLKLKVKDRLLNVNEKIITETDGVLSFSFNVDFWDLKESHILEQEEMEMMEILTTNIEQE